VATQSLKVFVLPVKVIAVGRGRQEALWLLHLAATHRGYSSLSFLGFMSRAKMPAPGRANRVDAEAVIAVVRAASLEPLVAHPGRNAPWSCRCVKFRC
jgi:hypothetical protein